MVQETVAFPHGMLIAFLFPDAFIAYFYLLKKNTCNYDNILAYGIHVYWFYQRAS